MTKAGLRLKSAEFIGLFSQADTYCLNIFHLILAVAFNLDLLFNLTLIGKKIDFFPRLTH